MFQPVGCVDRGGGWGGVRTGEPIGHIRFNILTWLQGFQVKIANFLSFFCLSIPKGDLDTKKTTPNIKVCPESLGAMLQYCYIERGLLKTHFITSFLHLIIILIETQCGIQ